MRKNPEIKIIRDFVSSGVLARQVDSGDDLDMVFVANIKQNFYYLKFH